ncbi:MAG: DUF1080 domain-containing protein [Bacteroidetes bacterium]|nr:DUF1080 domain-containing protein [Bacteroidota bacterium]
MIKNWCLTLVLFSILTMGCAASGPSESASQEQWIQLFDGVSLNGWTPKIRGYAYGENAFDTFQIRDGAISVSYEGYDTFDERFGHLFYASPFSYYKMAVEYRFTGEQVPGGPGWAFRNSGIMIHSPPGETMLIDQDFPISIEVQLLGGNGVDERTNANLCTPGTNVVMSGELVTNHCINSTSKTYHGDDWVRAEIIVLGDSIISHLLEGVVVLEYNNPQIGGGSVDAFDPEIKIDGLPLTGGYISLQSESHPIEFRKVELLNLKGCMDPKATNFKSYYVSDDPSSCIFEE